MMKREEAIKWLKYINTREFGWDEYAMQESQTEIRERCEQGVREAIDMAIEALEDQEQPHICPQCGKIFGECWNLIRCKDCKHRPHLENENGSDYGFNVSGDETCPCVNNDDGWYSWMPKDNFYCGFGERKGGDSK